MTKKNKGKPLKEIVFSTRNKATVLYSKLFGSEQTNKILDKTFSNNMVISKLLEAEKHGFDVSYGQDEKEDWVLLLKDINKSGIDEAECEEKYWNLVKEKLLKLYDKETTDAIIEHYSHLNDKDGCELLYNGIYGVVKKDKPGTENIGLNIEFYPTVVKEYPEVEKKVDNKTIRYDVNYEEIMAVFIESHIQLFG